MFPADCINARLSNGVEPSGVKTWNLQHVIRILQAQVSPSDVAHQIVIGSRPIPLVTNGTTASTSFPWAAAGSQPVKTWAAAFMKATLPVASMTTMASCRVARVAYNRSAYALRSRDGFAIKRTIEGGLLIVAAPRFVIESRHVHRRQHHRDESVLVHIAAGDRHSDGALSSGNVESPAEDHLLGRKFFVAHYTVIPWQRCVTFVSRLSLSGFCLGPNVP
jgi:hypothetical protein